MEVVEVEGAPEPAAEEAAAAGAAEAAAPPPFMEDLRMGAPG